MEDLYRDDYREESGRHDLLACIDGPRLATTTEREWDLIEELDEQEFTWLAVDWANRASVGAMTDA